MVKNYFASIGFREVNVVLKVDHDEAMEDQDKMRATIISEMSQDKKQIAALKEDLSVHVDILKQTQRERDALKEKVQSWESLESEFQSQEIAKELNLPLGSSIRKGILPGIIKLKEKVQELEAKYENHDNEWIKSTLYFDIYAENTALREALENIVLWAKGSTCEICGEKKMTDTDAYDYAKVALEQKETS